MNISIFDLFSIGIGPSSSHTVGPMRAAKRFLLELGDALSQIQKIQITLYGSLAHTCSGHGTNKALFMGLLGEAPETIDPARIPERMKAITTTRKLKLLNQHEIDFDPNFDLILELEKLLEYHSNGILLTAYSASDEVIDQKIYYSVGGGFVMTSQDIEQLQIQTDTPSVPHPFETAQDLLDLCRRHQCAISDIVYRNEQTWRSTEAIDQQLDVLAQQMKDCIERGLTSEETHLAGGLNVRRRAPKLYQSLQQFTPPGPGHPRLLNWLNVYAMAVNEENAAGNRVVTAPTNGAAGILPAVLNFYRYFTKKPTPTGIRQFLLTAGAIGLLYKQNASISGAEMGCQGEVGVACSMAAAGLTEAMGGSVLQVENAAEIAMEHNLGLTCDPVGGLVQVPCIERNAIGAVKAVNAAILALAEDEASSHIVSLDMVIKTMREIGTNMNSIYKETSKGGLAVNVPEC